MKNENTATKVCTKCNIEKYIGEFHVAITGLYGYRADCKLCVKSRQQNNGYYSHNKKNLCGCGRNKSKYSVLCQECNRPSLSTPGRIPTWRKASDGYIVGLGIGKREVRQHRWAMEQHLGRKLLLHENIHHKNGVRDDNRLENLELWSTSQPPGQRVDDKLEWCKWFIKEYS